MFKTYLQLTKPGIIMGNTITAAAGFLLASKGQVNPWLFLATLLGIALIIASACVFNNYIDRSLDRHMARTKKRALVTGSISARPALTFATVLGIAGTLILALFTNTLALVTTLIGFFVYVVLYGLAKRHTPYGTIVGSVAGAVPITAGYLAASGRFDTGAAIVFLILVLWQMPHFYAIAIYRLGDYTAARLPVLPVKAGLTTTKRHILLFIIAFTLTATFLTLLGYTGYIYLGAMTLLNLAWLRLGLQGLRVTDDPPWARRMFKFSLIVLMTFSLLLSLEAVLV